MTNYLIYQDTLYFINPVSGLLSELSVDTDTHYFRWYLMDSNIFRHNEIHASIFRNTSLENKEDWELVTYDAIGYDGLINSYNDISQHEIANWLLSMDKDRILRALRGISFYTCDTIKKYLAKTKKIKRLGKPIESLDAFLKLELWRKQA